MGFPMQQATHLDPFLQTLLPEDNETVRHPLPLVGLTRTVQGFQRAPHPPTMSPRTTLGEADTSLQSIHRKRRARYVMTRRGLLGTPTRTDTSSRVPGGGLATEGWQR